MMRSSGRSVKNVEVRVRFILGGVFDFGKFTFITIDCFLSNMAEVERPNKTLYVRNLDESIKLPILKQDLETIFSQFGTVSNVIAHKNIKMRGQAFVVFEDQTAAEKALGSVQQFPFHGKQMEVQYAKSQSDDTVKREASEEEFEQHKKQRLQAKGTIPSCPPPCLFVQR